MHMKSHKPQYDGAKPLWLDLWHLQPLHHPQPIKIIALTLFITLKGWETGVLHLGGPIETIHTSHPLSLYLHQQRLGN